MYQTQMNGIIYTVNGPEFAEEYFNLATNYPVQIPIVQKVQQKEKNDIIQIERYQDEYGLSKNIVFTHPFLIWNNDPLWDIIELLGIPKNIDDFIAHLCSIIDNDSNLGKVFVTNFCETVQKLQCYLENKMQHNGYPRFSIKNKDILVILLLHGKSHIECLIESGLKIEQACKDSLQISKSCPDIYNELCNLFAI